MDGDIPLETLVRSYTPPPLSLCDGVGTCSVTDGSCQWLPIDQDSGLLVNFHNSLIPYMSSVLYTVCRSVGLIEWVGHDVMVTECNHGCHGCRM